MITHVEFYWIYFFPGLPDSYSIRLQAPFPRTDVHEHCSSSDGFAVKKFNGWLKSCDLMTDQHGENCLHDKFPQAELCLSVTDIVHCKTDIEDFFLRV